MALQTRSAAKGPKHAKYSVLLPTYNEKDNIALIVWLLIDTFNKKCVGSFILLPLASFAALDV